jgi:hypothetical protein
MARTISRQASAAASPTLGVPDEAVEVIRARHATAAAWTSFGWRGPADLTDLSGLEGTFWWPESMLPWATIRFAFDAAGSGVEGDYTITSGWMVVERGRFWVVPNNPAIGWAGLTLTPASGAGPRVFVFTGLLTGAAGRIWLALVDRMTNAGPAGAPLAAVRVS